MIERATEKKPEKRYPDMATMLTDLESALEVEVARAGHAGGEATTVLDSVPERRRRILTSRRVSIAGILLVLAGTAAALLIAGLTGEDRGRGGGGGGEQPSGQEVTFVSATDFDPLGDESEHPEEAEAAIDGDSDSGWSTEKYQASAVVQDAAGKPGVGLCRRRRAGRRGGDLDQLDRGRLGRRGLRRDRGPADHLEGWGEPVGTTSGADTDEPIELDVHEPSRYYLIWLTKLAGSPGEYTVEITEASLTAAS